MANNVVKQIRKATRRRFSAEQKIRLPLASELPAPRTSGTLLGGDFAEWCPKNREDNEECSEQLMELGRLVDQINKEVQLSRAEAYRRGELEYADDEHPEDDNE